LRNANISTIFEDICPRLPVEVEPQAPTLKLAEEPEKKKGSKKCCSG